MFFGLKICREGGGGGGETPPPPNLESPRCYEPEREKLLKKSGNHTELGQ